MSKCSEKHSVSIANNGNVSIIIQFASFPSYRYLSNDMSLIIIKYCLSLDLGLSEYTEKPRFWAF